MFLLAYVITRCRVVARWLPGVRQGHEALDRKMPSESVTTELSIPTLILLPEYAGCQVVNMSRLCVRAEREQGSLSSVSKYL